MKAPSYFLLLLLSFMCHITWADKEIEIEFRLQPDGTGSKTRSQRIKEDNNVMQMSHYNDEN